MFADSTELKASQLARQQSEGYWLIRSTLVENSMFIDARGLSPVMAVVDKSYSASDYIYLGESSVDFMVTAQRTITDITTSLHLPDGSFAAVNDRNAVIYRIVKPNVAVTCAYAANARSLARQAGIALALSPGRTDASLPP